MLAAFIPRLPPLTLPPQRTIHVWVGQGVHSLTYLFPPLLCGPNLTPTLNVLTVLLWPFMNGHTDSGHLF